MRKYIVNIQFMGFRYHGFQKQKAFLTIHETLENSFKKAFPELDFKISGGSRTDAMVSAINYFIMLKVFNDELGDFQVFLKRFNDFLPQDIRAIDIMFASEKINLISHAKKKEYHYYFTFGEKPHPFVAGFMCSIKGGLNIEKMKLAAKMYVGTHNFRSYCYKPHAEKEFVRTIETCEILLNENYVGNFIPKDSYYLKVISKSFMRYQIRLMMGAIFKVGLGEIDLFDIENSLTGDSKELLGFIAPGAGLILNKVEYES